MTKVCSSVIMMLCVTVMCLYMTYSNLPILLIKLICLRDHFLLYHNLSFASVNGANRTLIHYAFSLKTAQVCNLYVSSLFRIFNLSGIFYISDIQVVVSVGYYQR